MSESEATARLSFRNRTRVLAAAGCGCFYCLAVFPADAVQKWVDDGQTALCPHCGIDSVLADVTDGETLRLLHHLRFEVTVRLDGWEPIAAAGADRGR